MRSFFWLSSGMAATLAFAAVPAHAQFAAEDPYQDPATPNAQPAVDPYAADPSATDPYATDPYAADPGAPDPYAADPYAADPYAADPYAASPATTAPKGALRDRTIGDVAAGLLGAKGAQIVSDAESVVRDIAGRRDNGAGAATTSPSPVSLVRDLIGAATKPKSGTNTPQ